MGVNPKIKLKALDIAKYFIYLGNKQNNHITNKKLQKLVYYSQVWSLVFTNRKLFDEDIEAWVHGPAIRSLYAKYKNFGSDCIIEDIKTNEIRKVTGKVKEILDEVWRIYGKFDAGYLETLTHSEEPWLKAREGIQSYESSENKISLEIAKKYYTKKLEEAKNNRNDRSY